MRKGKKEFLEEGQESLKDDTGCWIRKTQRLRQKKVKKTTREGQRILKEGPKNSSKKAQENFKEG